METLTEKLRRIEEAESQRHGIQNWQTLTRKSRSEAIIQGWHKERKAEKRRETMLKCLQFAGAFALTATLIFATQIVPEIKKLETTPEMEKSMVQALSAETIPTRPWHVIESATVYHYCPCEKCCGKSVDNPAYGMTRSGTVATVGRTIAVDPEIIPLGSEVVIDGQTYIAEDTGGAIKGYTVDIYCESHAEAVEKGVYQTEIKWREGEKQ